MSKEFMVIDGDTLMTAKVPQTEFIVENLIVPGLHILSGSPKIGKSWLVFWLCLKVSQGESVWKFKTDRGTALYLALEDNLQRVQDRLTDMTYDATSKLCVTLLSESISTGIEEQIKNFVNLHTDTKLIVIDTFQRIRSISNDNAYAVDYKDIGFLKRIADELKIAIIVVHHLRKEKHEDPIAMVSGTSGITGAADSIFVLDKSRRNSENATLYCTGRDIEYRELELHFNKKIKVWELIKDSVENPEILFENVVEDVVKFMKDNNSFIGTPTELAEKLFKYQREQITPPVLSKQLNKNQEELKSLGINYSSKRSNGKRIITLEKSDSSDGNPHIPITVPADPDG